MATGVQGRLPFDPLDPAFGPRPPIDPVTGVQQMWPMTGQPGMLPAGPQPAGALPSAGYPMPPAPPRPAPDMFGGGADSARQAAVAQARAANAGVPAAGRAPMSMNSVARQAAAEQAAAARPVRPSSALRDIAGPNAPVEDAISRQYRLADQVTRPPMSGQVGPNPPPNLPPSAQGVSGAGGANAGGRGFYGATGRGGVGGGGGGVSGGGAAAAGAGRPSPPRPPTNRNPFPKMSVVPGGDRLSRIARGRLGPSLAFGAVTAAGNRMDNSTLQSAGTAGTIGSMAGGGPIGAAAALGAGIAEGTAGEGTSYSRHLQDIYNGEMPTINSVGDFVSFIPAAGMSVPMTVLEQAGRAGDVVEDIPYLGDGINFFTDRFGGMAADMGSGNDMSLLNVPGVKQVAGFFGVESGPSEEDQAAAAAEAQRQQQMMDPDYMLQTFVRAGVPTDAAREAVAEYQTTVERNLALNEVDAFNYGIDSNGDFQSVFDESGTRRDDLKPLTEEDVRLMTAQGMYSAIPEIADDAQRRMDALNRAAAFQAIMSEATDPLMARSQQTVDMFNQYGDPIGAAYAQQAMDARLTAMQMLPMIQAIDEQQAWDQRIAQIQQEQLLNDLFYGGQQQGDASLDETIAGG